MSQPAIKKSLHERNNFMPNTWYKGVHFNLLQIDASKPWHLKAFSIYPKSRDKITSLIKK
jgi:hypothetical protein